MKNNSALTLKTRAELERSIVLLDLRPIKVKLMNPEEGNGWSREQVDQVEKLYRQFLLLSAVRSEPIVPTKEIDAFWHAHILDTEKYAEDCERTFGYFLHHFPYFGMRGSEDALALQSAFERTEEIFLEEFGVSPVADLCKEASCHGSRCGQCSGQSRCRSTSPNATLADVRPTLN